ncbi:MAG: hypothetical protein NBV60_10090 [Erythrobacter sp.]|nr:hypothetical protein [Erythrobacter sp.]
MTILGAVVIVGPQGGGGVLDQAVGTVDQKRGAVTEKARIRPKERSEEIEPLDPAAGWGGTGDPVFGDFTEEPVAETPESEAGDTAPGPEEAEPRALEEDEAEVSSPKLGIQPQ